MISNDLNDLAKACYDNSKRKGFWDDQINLLGRIKDARKLTGTSEFSKEEVEKIRQTFLSQRILHVISEFGESFEAQRSGKVAKWNEYQNELENGGVSFDADSFKQFIKDSPEDEIADAIILLLGICGGEGINIGKHVEHKMAYNSQRPMLHNKKH